MVVVLATNLSAQASAKFRSTKRFSWRRGIRTQSHWRCNKSLWAIKQSYGKPAYIFPRRFLVLLHPPIVQNSFSIYLEIGLKLHDAIEQNYTNGFLIFFLPIFYYRNKEYRAWTIFYRRNKLIFIRILRIYSFFRGQWIGEMHEYNEVLKKIQKNA